MIREQRPGVHGQGARLNQLGQAREEVAPIGVVLEDGPPLDASHHHVVQSSGGV
jgi:hypothetical protein